MVKQSYVVIVTAEDQDEKTYEVRLEAASNKALQEVRAAWAKYYRVEESEVSLEDQEERPIDLDRTPTELGWSRFEEPIKLWAIPVGDLAAEDPERDAADRVEKKEPEKREPETEPEAEDIPESVAGSEKRKHSGEASEDKPAKKQAVSVPEMHASLQVDTDAAAGAARAAERKAVGKAEAAKVAQQRPAERGPAAAEPMKSDPSKPDNPVRAPPSNPAAAKAASKPAGKAAAKAPGKAQAERKDPAERPGDDEPIKFLQDNPKMKGGKAHERYEKYKRATTPRQALQLGAGKGDLDNDWKKGFYQRA